MLMICYLHIPSSVQVVFNGASVTKIVILKSDKKKENSFLLVYNKISEGKYQSYNSQDSV